MIEYVTQWKLDSISHTFREVYRGDSIVEAYAAHDKLVQELRLVGPLCRVVTEEIRDGYKHRTLQSTYITGAYPTEGR